MSYHLVRWLIHLVVWLTARVEVCNAEGVDLQHGFIAVSNHLGRLDVAFVYHFLNRRDVTVLVAEKYKNSILFRWAVKALDAVWVDRFNADLVAMRESLNRLKKGHILVMAPEGTRSETGALIEARSGASYLAARSGAWIVPVATTGTEDRIVLQNLSRFRRSKVVIRVGEPFQLAPLSRENREAVLQEYTDEIMCRIAALLPPSYRGFYADHHRLQELLAASSSAATKEKVIAHGFTGAA
jgi:1-acyl-sn-glycerol-3-phosphate acyltransferase